MGLLDLHEDQRRYDDPDAFFDQLLDLLEAAVQVRSSIDLIRLLGLVEPLSGSHIPPERITLPTENWRESILADGLISRHRALLHSLATWCGMRELNKIDVYCHGKGESFTERLKRLFPASQILSRTSNESTHQADSHPSMRLTDQTTEAFICPDVLQEAIDHRKVLKDARGVLNPGGVLLATFPFAFNQREHQDVTTVTGPQRILGWDVLNDARAAGFHRSHIDYVASWKHGILSKDVPGVFVLVAEA